jgi:hypothetical protein
MELPHEMTTLTAVLNKLKQQNMDHEFRWNKKGFATQDKTYEAKDLLILKTYRFEGITDPSDMGILYLIRSNDGLTGYSLNAYGVYNDQDEGYDNFIRQIPEKGHNGQLLFEL